MQESRGNFGMSQSAIDGAGNGAVDGAAAGCGRTPVRRQRRRDSDRRGSNNSRMETCTRDHEVGPDVVNYSGAGPHGCSSGAVA